MYLAIIILPLLGSIVSGFFGRKVGVSGAQLITSLSVALTIIIAVFAFIEVVLNNIPVFISLIRWIDSESLNVLWGFSFDCLTISMLIPVLIISLLVHIYSIGYMSHDPHNQRFFSYLSLFTFMMIILVTANNFLLMFVGWEGVGVCSYLLVNFWFTRIAANQSSLSAFLTNRVGDCFLTLGMFVIVWTFGNLDYSTVFSLTPYINENAITIIGICLLIGAMAKSSQIGLHVWLPLAMEGPTPVSALIHAATMVTAGVYLLMRSSPLIEYSSTVLIICLWIGSVTTVFSSLIGLFQQDIKKVIAYSTMSQLGMMVIAVGLSSYNLALFHLVNHAFYKGLLFLGAGAVIHAVADNQDFRKYGGLLTFLPLTYTVMLIASLSLVAFPFMTGFYSKDFILESTFGQFTYSSITVYFIAVIGAIFTTLYSIKVLYLTFISNPNGPLISYKKAHEGDIFMSLPLIILAVFSIFFGYITKDIFIGLGTDLFADNSLFIHPVHEIMLNTEFAVFTLFKLLPLAFTLLLATLYVYIVEVLPNFIVYFKSSRLGYNVFNFFTLRFLVEFVYNKFVARFILNLGGQTTKVLDKGSVELIGPYGLEKGMSKLSESLSRLDTGVITSYALYILIGLILYALTPYIFYSDTSLFMLIIYILFVINKTFYIYNSSNTHLYKNIIVRSSLFELPFLCTLISTLSIIKTYLVLSYSAFFYHLLTYGFGIQYKKNLFYLFFTAVAAMLLLVIVNHIDYYLLFLSDKIMLFAPTFVLSNSLNKSNDENNDNDNDNDDNDNVNDNYNDDSDQNSGNSDQNRGNSDQNRLQIWDTITQWISDNSIQATPHVDNITQEEDQLIESLAAHMRTIAEIDPDIATDQEKLDMLAAREAVLSHIEDDFIIAHAMDRLGGLFEIYEENIDKLDGYYYGNGDNNNNNDDDDDNGSESGGAGGPTNTVPSSSGEGRATSSNIISDLESLILLLKNLTEDLFTIIIDTSIYISPTMGIIVPIFKISTNPCVKMYLNCKFISAKSKISLWLKR